MLAQEGSYEVGPPYTEEAGPNGWVLLKLRVRLSLFAITGRIREKARMIKKVYEMDVAAHTLPKVRSRFESAKHACR